MAKDKNARKREELTRKICRVEDESEKLFQKKQEVEHQLDRIQAQTHQSFDQTTAFYSHLFDSGDKEALMEVENDQLMQQRLSQQLEENREKLEQDYQQQSRRLKEERESLYQKKGALSWD